MPEVVRSREIAAPTDEVWGALADFGAIGRWAPSVEHSCLMTAQAEGVGTTRRIQAGRLTLVERVTEWEAPTTLAYTIEGLPPIAGSIVNRWRVEPTDGRSAAAQVSLTSTVAAGPRPPHRVAARIVARRLATVSEELLAGLDRLVSGRLGASR